MKVVTVCAQSFGSNTYILVSGKEALIVDPSVSVSAILEAVRAEDAYPVGILLTHGHFDHIISLDTLRDATNIDAYIHEDDAIMLTDGKKNAFFEFFGKERVYRPAEKLIRGNCKTPLENCNPPLGNCNIPLKNCNPPFKNCNPPLENCKTPLENCKIPLGNEEVKVIHTPGHTPGSVCYMCGESLITGDTIFAESFGRCDLWGGSIEQMSDSLRLLRELPRETVIYPGHGPASKLWSALDNVAYLL